LRRVNGGPKVISRISKTVCSFPYLLLVLELTGQAFLEDEDVINSQDREYDLITSEQTLIPYSVVIPTSTSSRPIQLRIPVTGVTTVADSLAILRRDLGLPVSTLDLVGPGSRSKGSRSMNSPGEADTAIKWAIRLDNSTGIRLNMGDLILDSRVGSSSTIHVSIDEDWLFETTPSHINPQTTTPCDRIPEEEDDQGNMVSEGDEQEEDKEDTLKAQSPRKRTTMILDETATPPHSSGQARLSGLFNAWVDTNAHPAPPPTPQLTLVGSDATTALAEALAEDHVSQAWMPPPKHAQHAQLDNPHETGTPGELKVSSLFPNRLRY
jgi:hypothetical protein